MKPELTTTTPRHPQNTASDFKIQRIQHNPASICQYRIDSPCKVCTSRFPGVRHTQVLQNSFEKLRGACSPSGESPHLSFIAVPTSRTVSELTGAITSGLSHSEHPLGTPQGTSGKGGSITPSYFISVILTHVAHSMHGSSEVVSIPPLFFSVVWLSTEGVQGLSNFGFPPPYSLSH